MINQILPNQDGNQHENHRKKYEKAGTSKIASNVATRRHQFGINQ